MRHDTIRVVALVLTVLAGACTSGPSTARQQKTSSAPEEGQHRYVESLVEDALISIASGDNEGLTSLILPEDQQFLAAADRHDGAGSVLLNRLTAGLVAAFGPTGVPKLQVSFAGSDSDYQRVDVSPSEEAPSLPVFVTGSDPKVDLIASFAAYVASDLLDLAKSDEEIRSLLTKRLHALEVSDTRALPNLRSQPGKLRQLIRLLKS